MLSMRAPPRTFSPPPWRRRGRHGGFAAPRCASAAALAATLEADTSPPASLSVPILVNGCTGKMGVSVAEAATSRGLHLVPVSFSSRENLGKTVQIGDTEIEIYGPSAREDVLSSVIDEFPDVVVVDYTAPDSVNSNAELYCKLGVPFVMGTTGGDQKLLYNSVQDSNNYALISPQMGKQVVAFLSAMETIAVQYPGAFSGYRLEVLESHQAGKLDTSGTAKAVIACFEKLGVSWDMDRIVKIRDPEQQLYMVGVPEEHIEGHAFHLYHLTSPDDSVSFEFQHNVCGRSIYAEGSVDAAVFLHKKVLAGMGRAIVAPTSVESLLEWWLPAVGSWPSPLRPEVRSIFFLALRSIWIERNNRVFKNKCRPEASILDDIVEEAERWRLVGFL